MRDKDNEYHRQQWANMSKDAKRNRTEQIDKNKMDRRDSALESSDKDWCKYGGHAVDKQEMIFCPIQDLGLQEPGQIYFFQQTTERNEIHLLIKFVI